MIQKTVITDLALAAIDKNEEMFLVNVKISPTNKITVLIDTYSGVTIDECVALHRYIEEHLNRDEEDFELQVSSPGLGAKFLVIEQYYKSQGETVEITDEDGNIERGTLKEVDEQGIILEITKNKENFDKSYLFGDIKKTVLVVDF